MGKFDYLYGHSPDDDLWHALLFHDPEYVLEWRASKTLTAQALKKNPDADPVMVSRVAETKPGRGGTVCELGIDKVRGPDEIVRREGIPLDSIGVDPDDNDKVCLNCITKIAALKSRS